ncbi:hypothetical protein M433DRAFT_148861 [Acidomyces richmondensis BFW]|nr:MAG: hypothetical protein FE78DRAFT_84014 [Acidomyces sp. 'richmondensis']KYG50429.1 hypothetical protein M433DRAFT_148861 [Acidomyces richmondensis BFW]
MAMLIWSLPLLVVQKLSWPQLAFVEALGRLFCRVDAEDVGNSRFSPTDVSGVCVLPYQTIYGHMAELLRPRRSTRTEG